jgi:hypothetical protein
MDIRKEIKHGDLTTALPKLHNYGVPEVFQNRLIRSWELCIELHNTWHHSDSRLHAERLEIQRQALELLDKYSPDSEVPLHECEATMELYYSRLPVSIEGTMLIGGRAFNTGDLKRMIACWNACKGIPTEDINEDRGFYGRMAAKNRQAFDRKCEELVNIVTVIRPLIAEWKRQKGLFPELKKDGWMDDAIKNVVSEVERIGLGGMLGKTEPSLLSFYFSLGQAHRHKIIDLNGQSDEWTPNKLLHVMAEDESEARGLVHGKFGQDWAFSYNKDQLPGIVESFPDGIIVADSAWLRFKNT